MDIAPDPLPVLGFGRAYKDLPYDVRMRVAPTTFGLPTGLALAVFVAAPAHAQVLDTDVPFVVSPPAVTEMMLKLAGVGPKDYVIDLGSGDGRIVILAALKHGARGLGVEIDPKLVKLSRTNAQKAGVAARAEFRDQDLFKTDLSQATVITMYLLPDVNMLLRPRLLALVPGTRIISHDWDMGDWLPDEEVTIPVPDKPLGVNKSSRIMRWTVPARIEGMWCEQRKGQATITIRQRHQRIEGTFGKVPIEGRVDGYSIRTNLGEGTLQQGRLVFALPGSVAGEWRREWCTP